MTPSCLVYSGLRRTDGAWSVRIVRDTAWSVVGHGTTPAAALADATAKAAWREAVSR